MTDNAQWVAETVLLTSLQLEILQHALGVDQYGRGGTIAIIAPAGG